MYLKKLEMFGFKSFSDKTVLNFEPGITAVIGPNGCGKSNVFDAIRWVLGEQSVRQLRGASMEDVIFNGTAHKPGLGFAEVSLTFSNDSRRLPVDYAEVTVTRRLFRSGESEYLLNKTQVRLKDIVELFMGTGIGADSYSLVQQGKVDLVVSAKPEDRRIILDEASGVTKYKAKRKESLSKLKDTENNLLRINDIVVEVKRQISSLERQAKKARRYKDEFEKLKGLEVRSANHELGHFKTKRQHMQARLRESKIKETRLIEESRRLNDCLSGGNGLLEGLEKKLNGINAEDIKFDGHIDIHNRQIGFNEERIESILSNEKRIAQSKEQLLKQCRAHHGKMEEVNQGLTALDNSVEKNSRDIRDMENYLSAIASAIKEARAAIQYEEKETLDITSNQVAVNNRLTEATREGQGALARKRRLEIENTKVAKEKEEAGLRLNDMVVKIESSKNCMLELQDSLAVRKQDLKEQIAQLTDCEGFLDRLEKEKLSLESQKEFIEKLSVQYQDIPDPVVEGRLFIDVPPMDHHTGIIGKVKEVLPANSSKYEIICETKFIELDPQQISARIARLSDEITEKAARRDALITGVREHRRVIAGIGLDIQEEEKGFSVYQAQRKDLSGEVDKFIEELAVVGIELEKVTGSMDVMKGEEDNLTCQLSRLDQDFDLSQLKIKEKQDWIALKSKEREQTTVSIAHLEAEGASFKDKKSDYLKSIVMFKESLNSSLEEMKRLEHEYEELKKGKEQFAEDMTLCKNKIIQIKEEKESLRDSWAVCERNREAATRKITHFRADITACGGELEGIRKDIHDKQFSEQDVVFKEKEIRDRLWQAYKIDLDAFAVDKEEGAGDIPSVEGPQAGEELKAEIERCAKRCNSFGAVNLVAIEEFDELRERFEFLTKQQSDLITARESLLQAIRKINSQTRQMFMDTFTRVSEEFRIYYRMLFGGGDAQLVLLDPENVLESGIDIVARPPGKKLQNIDLLSGGEKTLTAIALIFGVFKVNPSPFCVLDEIDAALDESNVGRFNYLLKDFSKIAQFIIITHNKKTIASADVMYGITMQETGVSKIVSVKFGNKDKEENVSQGEEALVGV